VGPELQLRWLRELARSDRHQRLGAAGIDHLRLHHEPADGRAADLNGNILQSSSQPNIFDIENRLVEPGSGSTARYAYDPGNKRVWRGDSSLDEIDFFSAGGLKLGTYQLTVSGSITFAMTTNNIYFGTKLVSKGTPGGSATDHVNRGGIVADRQGSISKFYPYGIERPSATGNDTEKFTAYYRDSASGLDYADQRYHQPGVGRFMTPDPYSGSAKSSDSIPIARSPTRSCTSHLSSHRFWREWISSSTSW
jgi:RHS repeat-associated protein